MNSYPVDESVYGVRGLGGNVEDWCLDIFTKTGPPLPHRIVEAFGDDGGAPARAQRVRRGGVWDGGAGNVRAARRGEYLPEYRDAGLGFRLARRWDGGLA